MSFPKAARYRIEDSLELVHGALCGLIVPVMHGGQRHFLRLVDDYSRYMWLQLLMSKSDAMDAIKQLKARTEVESEKRLKVMWTDRGGEFTVVEFAAYR